MLRKQIIVQISQYPRMRKVVLQITLHSAVKNMYVYVSMYVHVCMHAFKCPAGLWVLLSMTSLPPHFLFMPTAYVSHCSGKEMPEGTYASTTLRPKDREPCRYPVGYTIRLQGRNSS